MLANHRSKGRAAHGRSPHSFMRYLAALGLGLLCTSAMGQTTESQESALGATSRELQKRILEGLLKGQPDPEAREAWREIDPPRRPERPRSREAAELRVAVETFLRASESFLATSRQGTVDAEGFLAAYDALRAADLLFSERFRTVEQKLAAATVTAEILERARQARQSYEEGRERFLGSLQESAEALRQARLEADSPSNEILESLRTRLADARDWLRSRLEEKEYPILRAGLLPYRPARLTPKPLTLEPLVIPTYEDPSDVVPMDDDLAPGPEAPFSEAILGQAEALEHDYVRIFEFVRNEIDTEWYAGSMKGAEGTLFQTSGNDVDQASLLVALLRASRAPARYVRGVIRVPLETLASDMGVSPTQVTDGLTRAGIAHRSVVQGGRVAAVELEHTWVSVRVPYTNYRGAVVDVSGATWVPLFPALKRVEREPASGVLEEMEFSASNVVQEYLSGPQPVDPLTQIRESVISHLEQISPDESYQDQLATETLTQLQLGLLPSSIPVEVVAVTGESAALDPAARHLVRFVARRSENESDPVVLDFELPLAELLGARVTVSYQPATLDDHTTVNLFGGLDSVPLYLVRLRPQVLVNGRRVAVGQEPLEPGTLHRIEIELKGPFGTETISLTARSGGYYAFAFTAQRDRGLPPFPEDPADSEAEGGRLLSRIALQLSERWGEAEAELAGLLDVTVLRPLPAVVIAANAVDVETVFGLPVELSWEGVTLDAALRIAEPLARDGAADKAESFFQLSALQGSSLEHFVFEEEFLVESISADKGLGLARSAGIEVLDIDASNISSALPRLVHPGPVIAEIENWVRLGRNVEIPLETIQHNAWTGSVWRVEDPATGAAGYFISGGLAGGQTSEPPENWVLDFLADALESPYSPAPNRDPLAGVEITKIGASDGQTGVVDELLPTELAVIVRDVDGRPVEGAVVEFLATFGGGKLVDEEGVEAELVLATTDALGIAAVGLKLGQVTLDNPVYVLRNAADEFATRALVNEVDAVALSRSGSLLLDAPFTALGLPDDPASLLKTSGGRAFGAAGLWSDAINVQVVDRFENPISNQPVTFSVGAPTPLCTPPPAGLQNAVVFDNSAEGGDCSLDQPVLGDCGSPSMTKNSSVSGAGAGVILGNATNTNYHIDVSSSGLASLGFDIQALGICSQGPDVISNTSFLVNEFGFNISAAKVGEQFPRPIQVTLYYSDPDFEVRTDSEGKFVIHYLSTRRWVRTTATVTFDVANGGSASEAEFIGNGTYQTLVTTGPTPGRNEVGFQATDLEMTLNRVNRDSGEVFQVTERVDFGDELGDVFGVLPEITEIDPTPVLLTDSGKVAAGAQIHHRLSPNDYFASSVNVDVYEDGEFFGTAIGQRVGEGFIRFQRGIPIEFDKSYEAELMVNRGSDAQMRSERVEIPFQLRIFTNLDRSVFVSQDVDLLNDRTCSTGSTFNFTTTQEATITLKFKRISSENTDGSLNFGEEVTLIDEELMPAGDHEIAITPSDLLPADYRFELIGVSSKDGHEETEEGFARSEFKTRDLLPVGHAMVKGVDLFDGHLVVSRSDFQFPGRGLPLSFSRTYSSNAGAEGGLLGVGWSHNLGSKIIVSPCGEVIIIGGQGSGQRFVDDGDGGLRPLRGYHGSLVANPEDNTFDFYTLDGSRHHYVRGRDEVWFIEFSADTNGNMTEYVYDRSGREPQLASVQDAAGRSIQLTYERKTFRLWSGEVITVVEASGGIRLDLQYDDYGNLVRAQREPHPGGADSMIESYSYATGVDVPLDFRHRLMTTLNEVNGATTTYEYDRGVIGLQGNIQVPSDFVMSVKEPEGGVTRFLYEPAALASRAPPEIPVEVTEPRNGVTKYHLNQYGSPLRIEDPEGGVVSMTWSPVDVVMLSRTDANNVVTTFVYDDHANLVSESVTVQNFDGSTNTYSIVNTYWPRTSFNPPFAKNRVRTRKNRNGTVTSFSYDSRGNLTKEEVIVETLAGPSTLTTVHTYDSLGNRRSTRNPRGHTTFFEYDVYGNLQLVIDPRGGETRTVFDVRGRPFSQTDALGRITRFTFDTLGRVIAQIYPGNETDTKVYDDVGRTVTETDAEGRKTTSFFDREGRTVRIENAAGGTRVIEYDLAGNKNLETEWFDGATPRFDIVYGYDLANRLIRRTEPLGRVTEYGYDAAGNLIRETLSDTTSAAFLPRVSEWSYDSLNRQVTEERLLETGRAISKFKYDGEGNRVFEIDPLERETTFRFDGLNRLLEQKEPVGKTTQFVYDGNGNVVEERRLNIRDQIRKFEYDELDRPIGATNAEFAKTLFEYDAVGNLIREIDPRLHVTSFAYDVRNRKIRETLDLTRVSIPSRNVTAEFGYDKVGNLIEERQPNGNVFEATYDPLNRLTSSRDGLGPIEAFDYDARGNSVRQFDGNGNVTESDYDRLNRVREQRSPESRTLRFTYDVAGNVLTQTDARGNTTAFAYDRLNRLVRSTDPAPFGFTVESTYDLVGNKLTETDRRGNTTSFTYDELDRVIRSTDPAPLSFVQTFTYDALGNRLTARDRRGILTELIYDRENRLIRTVHDGVVIEVNQYDPSGNRRFITDANGNIVGFEYDERNLLIAENRPLAAITRFKIDDMGDVIEIRDPENRITEREYDRRRRLTAETNHDGERTEFEYDLNGNRTLLRRPESNEWRFTYDGADRLRTVVNDLGQTTSHDYDANDNQTTIVDANNHQTLLEYDELNRRVAMVKPDSAREETDYDPSGNPSEIRDALGQIIELSYDVLNREANRSFSNPADPTGDDLESIATDYDPNGNPLTRTETYSGATGVRVTQQTFDTFDRLLSVTDPESKTITYGYDANGNRTRLRDPDGRITLYTFDELNRTVSVALTLVGVTEYSYFRDSRLRRVRYPNGSQADNTYDAAGRIATVENTHNSGLVSRFEYTYDDNGNRINQIETNGGPAESTHYHYDEADRLLAVEYPEKTTTYTYDAVGNRLTEQELDTASALITDKIFTYNNRDQVERIDNGLDPLQGVVYTYDANGNQTSKTKGSVSTVFDYDIRDKLVTVTQGAATLGRFTYDYQGLRIRKETPSKVFRYVYDDQSVLLQTDDAGSTIAKYDYGPDRLLSLAHVTEPRQFYLFDALKSISNLMTDTGAVQARYQYDAWGNFRNTVGTSFNPFGFTGHERDDETGLYYARARFYDPEIGRFLSEDPFEGVATDPPSLHRYLYAKNNPTIFVDPTGEVPVLDELQEFFKGGGTDAAAALAADLEPGLVGSAGAVVLGIFGAAADLTGMAVGIVNTGANAIAAGLAPNTEIGRQAAEDLDETVTSFKETVGMIVEDPGAVGTAIVNGVIETGKGVLEGDPRAITQTTSFVAQLLVPAPKGVGAVKKVSGALRSGARVTRKAAGEGVDAAKRGLGQLKQVANRTRQAQRQAKAPKGACTSCPRTPSAVTKGKKPPARMCFVAGTPIVTAEGDKPIEEIRVGDFVWSRNDETEERRLQRVVQLFVTPNKETLDLDLVASDGTSETLGVTKEHPFWVTGRGWVEAGQLREDDSIFTARDGWLKVRQVRGSPRGAETVYNFEVAEDHTYFVGKTEAWVHNQCKTVSGKQPKGKTGLGIKRQGDLGEEIILEKLLRNPKVRVKGTRISVKTAKNPQRRVIDVLIIRKRDGKLFNVEVKTVGAKRPRAQRAKDVELEKKGGTFVGDRAADAELQGATGRITTVEAKVSLKKLLERIADKQ